jgi:hypothetical protein
MAPTAMHQERATKPALCPNRGGRPALNPQGQTFGTLVALRRDRDPRDTAGWLCQCQICGTEVVYVTSSLRRGGARLTVHPQGRQGFLGRGSRTARQGVGSSGSGQGDAAAPAGSSSRAEPP